LATHLNDCDAKVPLRFHLTRSREWLAKSRKRHFQTRLNRRSIRKWKPTWKGRTIYVLSIFALLGIFIVFGYIWPLVIVLSIPVLAILAGIMFVALQPLIGALWLFEFWSDRRNPNLGKTADIDLTVNGLLSGDNLLIAWTEICDVTVFDDGVLLNLGRRAIWLPFAVLTNGSQENVIAFLRSTSVEVKTFSPR
jgi:hypothetical protein